MKYKAHIKKSNYEETIQMINKRKNVRIKWVFEL